MRRLSLLVLAAALLAACGGGDETSAAGGSALAVVVGARANAASPVPLPPVQELLRQAADRQANAAVIVAAGTPVVEAQGPLQVAAKNEFAAGQEKAANVARLDAAVRGAKAATPEANLLGALDLAARSVAQVPGPKAVVVVDSGQQTVAPLRFQDKGLLAADPQEVAGFLERSNALPRLAGVRVVFSGLGDTAPPQQPLSIAQRENLVAIWRAVAEKAGATVEVLEAPLGTPGKPDLPSVARVPVDPPPLATGTVIELGEETVGFEPGTATYREPAEVEKVLAPLAKRIASQGLRVTLTGATASAGTPDYRRDLSLKRAEAVKATLVSAGAPAARITTKGVGSDWARHIPDTDQAGNLLPGPAARNRLVLVELSR